jgi:lipopolysaccharide transport system permease protein
MSTNPRVEAEGRVPGVLLEIRPRQGLTGFDMAELWRYRELFGFLAWRDILVRYKQTVIGILWAVIRPVITTVLLTFIFNKVGKISAPDGVPYALLVLTGNLPWQFFATALGESSSSLVVNANMISKVYFPRLIIPASSVITSFVDFLITLGLLAVAMACWQFVPDWRLLTLPLFIGLAFAGAFGAGLWLAALNLEYRDFRYIVPFIVQFGMLASPVGFVSSKVPEKWLLLYSLNPMVGVIDGFRWALLRGRTPLLPVTVTSAVCVAGILCLSGLWYFRKMERKFADIV